MKLNTKFLKPYGELTLFAGLALVSLSFYLLYVSIDKKIQINIYKEQFSSIVADTQKYKQHITELNADSINKPSDDELIELKSEIQKHAELVVNLRTSILPLMTKLEELLPESVHLNVLEHDIKTQQIKIIAIADDISGMSVFLNSLEKDNAYSSVLLKRQATVQLNDVDKIEFELSIKENLAS